MMTMLTRSDAHVGVGLFDSIKWAFEEHLQQPDNPAYGYAVLYGNEDCPERIDFWRTEPMVGVAPHFVWTRKQLA